MSDADCTPGREPRSVAASLNVYFRLWCLCVSECRVSAASKHACDEAAARRLWDESSRLVRLTADETHPLLPR